MKRYIVCIPRKWENDRQVAIPYSIMAESPLAAAREIFARIGKPLHKDTNGEVCVVEAKAGRLDNWLNYYTIDQLLDKRTET